MTSPLQSSAGKSAWVVLHIGVYTTSLFYFRSQLLGSDSFFFGKAFLLALCAAVGVCTLLLMSPKYAVDTTDGALAVLLIWLGLSSVENMNGWGSSIATTGIVASVTIFLISRSVSLTTRRTLLLVSVAGALGMVVLSALLESFTPLQLSDRPPGGTIGNRNRMAHLVVIGFPTLVYLGARSRSLLMLVTVLVIQAMAGTALLLSRSRGAWLALLVLTVVATTLFLLRRQGAWWCRRTRRVVLGLGAFACGVLGAFVLPNSLEWNSPTPYRDSVTTLTDFRSGSGAGRVTEYRNTLAMISAHPWIGVGPGNWRIMYPHYATAGDPNIEQWYYPVRRFPQGEWIGTAAERGVPSLLAVMILGGLLMRRWLRALVRGRSRWRGGYAFLGLATMSAVVSIGVFDPLVMTPTAGMVVPILFGVCAAPFAEMRSWKPQLAFRCVAVVSAFIGSAYMLSSPARELWGALAYTRQPTLEGFEFAAWVAPDDFRAHYFSADVLVQRGDCVRASPHIAEARRLYPTAPAVEDLAVQCEGRAEVPERADDISADFLREETVR